MKNLRYAFKRSLPIMVGFFPLGVAYGVLMMDAGYNFLWSGFTSAVVLAGSLQFLMLSFFAGGLPLFTIIVMALLLNSRHIFYGLSFLEKFRGYGPWKYFLIFGLSDESYSLLCSYTPVEELDEKRVHIITTALLWLYWTLFSMLGGLVGSWISFDTTGIDFALTALFVVILVDKLKGAPSRLPALVGVSASLLCILLFGAENFILPSLLLTVAVLSLLRPRLKAAGGKEGA